MQGTSFITIAAYAIAIVATYFMTMRQMGVYYSDFAIHATWSIDGTVMMYPLWHLTTRFFYAVLSLPLNVAASISACVFALATVVIMRWAMLRMADGAVPVWLVDVALIVAIFAGSLYIPWIRETYYLGTGGPVTWHNPTNATVKPFALWTCFLYAFVYATSRRHDTEGAFDRKDAIGYVCVSLLLVVCNLAKPSFFQVFMPAVFCMVVVDFILTKGATKKSMIASFLMVVPTMLVFVIQYGYYFVLGEGPAGEAHVVIAPLLVWSYYSENIPYSLLCLVAFPLYAYLLSGREELKNPYAILPVLCFVFGIAEYALFAQTGKSTYAGNFAWGYYIACAILWTSSLVLLAKQISGWEKASTIRRIAVFGCCILLLACFIGGVYYYWLVMTGAHWF